MYDRLFDEISANIDTVITRDTPLGVTLWNQLLAAHPADTAQFLSQLPRDQFHKLFVSFPSAHQQAVFGYLSDTLMAYTLSFFDDQQRLSILESVSIDDLTDIFDQLSDEELKKYLNLLSTHDREKVVSLLQFDPESAGGLMDANVLTLMRDFTVEKSIQILQRLQPDRDLHQQIYVVSQDNKLLGHINIEDLVLQSPQVRIGSIMRQNELVVAVHEDQESIAQRMVHYHLMTVPVVAENQHFLGVIPTETLVEIIEKEATEDLYKISAMAPIKQPYFETSFARLLFERSYILILLLFVQSFSSSILKSFETTLSGFLIYFITMLISTGGNTSSQTSALVIQGMASGEITDANIGRFLRREWLMAGVIAIILGIFSFIRVYITHGHVLGSVIVSLSLALIVLVSVLLGSCVPIVLRRLNIDPAFSAGPVLATVMDVLGLLIYCYVSSLLLGYLVS